MRVAGLLSPELLSTIFLNVEELGEVNGRFTETLKDAIEIALEEGDEDLTTVKIGKLFTDNEAMLGAFKSYCTRQVNNRYNDLDFALERLHAIKILSLKKDRNLVGFISITKNVSHFTKLADYFIVSVK